MKTWLRKFCVAAGLMAVVGAQASALQDATIKIDRPVNSPTLSVRFSGVKVAMVELKVNGKSVSTRVVNAEAAGGEATFTLDTDSLAEGDNAIQVVLFDADGKIVGRQENTVKMGHKGDAAVYLEGVKAGSQMKGTVELKLGLNRDFRDIYVSFFVDDEWRSLRNTAPYSYFWDTTRHTNGWHEVQAWVVDETNNTFKTQKVKVYVNNPGGRTERVDDPTKTSITKPVAKPEVKPEIKPEVKPEQKLAVTQTPVKTVALALDTNLTKIQSNVSTPSGLKPISTPSEGVAAGVKTLTPTGKRTVEVATPKVVAKPKVEVKPEVKTTVEPKVFTPEVKKPVAVKPLPEKIALAVPTNTLVKVNYGFRLNPGTKINLSYGGKKVMFPDVQPRVNAAGIPVAPFRFLFQQAGGDVKWFGGKKQMVSATGLGQNIQFWIGKRDAKVNNETFKMETKPTLEKNRAVVPVSFVQKALKVNVDYDKKTNHVLITAAGK